MPFKIVEAEDYVRIPPTEFGKPLEEIALAQLRKRYEGRVLREVGYIVAVLSAKVDREGRVVFGDGGTFHKSSFTLLAYMPLDGEVVEGVVENVREMGMLVRVGPVLGFINKIHVMDEPNVFFDASSKSYVGERTKRKVTVGDVVRARITGVSFTTPREGSDLLLRVTLTMRMPGLGKLDWIRERKPAAKKA
ncbi:MAG: DNA-directed RNA polymerase [Pyrobaculum sp.]